MKKLIFTGLLCLLLAGCGSRAYFGPIQNLPYVPQEESVKLIFLAEEKSFTSGWIAGVYTPIIDGIEAYSLELDHYVSFNITPDEHIVKCSGNFLTNTHPESIIRIIPQIGETVYLYCEFKSSPYRYAVTQLPEDQAQELMRSMVQVGAR